LYPKVFTTAFKTARPPHTTFLGVPKRKEATYTRSTSSTKAHGITTHNSPKAQQPHING
jgi:hypothetical protein